jgi:hypothetical protein
MVSLDEAGSNSMQPKSLVNIFTLPASKRN